MTIHSTNTDALSPSGILMIIIAAIGLLSAFIMIICLLALSRRRIRTENQIETFNRVIAPSYFRPLPRNFDPMQTQIRVRSLFGPCPSMDPKFEFRPPTYEEAMHMASSSGRIQPATSNRLEIPQTNNRPRSPPPAFSEVDPSPQSIVSPPASNELLLRQNNVNVATISSRYNTIPMPNNTSTQPSQSTL